MEKLLIDNDFRKIMQKTCRDIISNFFTKNQDFGILCDLDNVDFNPLLPKSINEELNSLTLFFLSGFTFESARIIEDKLVFEAGFGLENFASVVSISLDAIVQIIVDESVIFVNISTYEKKINKDTNDDMAKKSMESFLANAENSKFIKKR